MGMKRIQPSDDFDAQESCIWNRKSVETWISSRSWGTVVIAALTFWHMSCAVRGPRADTHVENLYCRKSAPLPTGRGGKLIPPWTVELATAGEKARADLHGRELIVGPPQPNRHRGAGRKRAPAVNERKGQAPLWRVYKGGLEKTRVNVPLTVLTAWQVLSHSHHQYQWFTRS